VGRILRAKPDKQDPVVCVFVDDIPILRSFGKKMQRWFREQGYEVKSIEKKEKSDEPRHV
jgi:hypothetical protein